MLKLRPENKENNNEFYGDFSRRQKTAVIFLAVLSLLVVAAWLVQVNYQIRQPFKSPEKKEQDSMAELNLALIDSDGDGLSDYDELNVYKTSPYIEDTDSDGISDYDEVTDGTNPTCPEGKNCYGRENLIGLDDNTSDPINYDAASSQAQPSSDSSSETVIDPEQVTPNLLRQILLENGYDAATLNAISDEDLMASYQEALLLGSEVVSEE